MAYEPKDDDISLFKNDNRTKDTQPTHRGTMLWNGQKLKISLWPKQSKEGLVYLGGNVQVDDYIPTQAVPASAVDDFIAPAQSELPPSEVIPAAPETNDLSF